MNTVVKDTLSALDLGEAKARGKVTLLAVFGGEDAGPAYLTLPEALAAKFFTVTERDEAGSVPELRVKNAAEVPVLIIDGEELQGAKQNRVVNTTILVKEKSETIIPVSCTEQGRWHYTSETFADSGVVMARQVRSRKSRSVSASLVSAESYAGDQGEVWDEIDELHADLGVRSPTHAMRDAYEANEDAFRDWLQHFPLEAGQRGLLVFLDGQPLGMDLVSRSTAYSHMHERLLKSYLIGVPTDSNGGEPVSPEQARQFLDRVQALDEQAFPSRGHGTDYRYEGDTQCGSALVHQDTCIHAAFFEDRPQGRDRAPHEPGLSDLYTRQAMKRQRS